MNLDYLQSFLTVARYASFTKAAAELHIGQSAISRHISGLEQEFGAQLLARNTHSVAMTPAGLTLYDEGTRIMAQIERTTLLVKEAAKGATGALNVAGLAPSVAPFLDIYRSFASAFPTIVFKFKMIDAPQMISAMEQKQVDICIGYMSETDVMKHKNIHSEVLAVDQLKFVVTAKSHLAEEGREFHLSDFASETLLVADNIADEHIGNIHYELKKYFTKMILCDSMDTLLLWTHSERGVALFPRMLNRLQGDDFRELNVVDFSEPVELRAMWNTENPNPTIDTFVQHIRKNRKRGY